MQIKVLGPGCKSCHLLEQRTREALTALGRDDPIEHVTDPATIASYDVMRTPALVLDEEVAVSGHVPTAASLRELLLRSA